MDFQPDKQSEVMVIVMKIVGAIVAVVSFRWVVKIFAGDDGKLNLSEFKKMAAFMIFSGLAIWMVIKEGTRQDLSHEVYGMGYLAIIFGSLLTVLHLDSALDKITKMIEALAKLRRPGVSQEIKEEVQPTGS